jgi:hypothetical protein
MAKMSGIPLVLTVANSNGGVVDISNDVNSVTLNTSRGEQDITGLDKEAIERLLLLTDAELGLTGTFNELLSHRVFRDCGSGNPRAVSITLPGGGALDVLAMNLVFASYVVSRGADGALTWTTTGKLFDGVVPVYA